MAQTYAKNQPAGFANHIEKVAIVGVGGRIGGHFATELLKTGKHTITALTRADSKSPIPAGIKVARVDYDDEESLISALKGQQFFIITLSVRTPKDVHGKLVRAAAKAGVPYIMPNAYGFDGLNRKLVEEATLGPYPGYGAEIEGLGAKWIMLTCGMWYEWSLALGDNCFGIDIKNKKVTFYDEGKTAINVSTWAQCGRALAKLLSLKELPEDGDDEAPTVARWANKALYISSWKGSQREMLDSVHRVLGDTDKEWEIVYEKTEERYKKGVEAMKGGDIGGFQRAMYSRVFFPNGGGDFETSKGLANESIGLQKEELDEMTRMVVEKVQSGWNPWA